MGSNSAEKPHAVLLPFPAQGHITPMMNVAKLLHSNGFYVTFVNTKYNQDRLLRSRGSDFLVDLEDFRFETIPDGLPATDVDGTQDVPSLCDSTSKNCLAPFRDVLSKLNRDPNSPPVTCVVSDGIMSFSVFAAEELGIPCVLFWTTSACGFLAYLHYNRLADRGLSYVKNVDDLTKEYLSTPIDYMPGLSNMRLQDYPSFIRTADPNDAMLETIVRETGRTSMASAIILNTYDDLEGPALEAMSSILPPVYTIGPLHFLASNLPPNGTLDSLNSSLWKEDTSCLEFLEGKEAGSVVYVNFGSITVMTNEQLLEFAWGLANSNMHFLWVIRPDLVRGDDAVLPEELLAGTKERGLLASWCDQAAVLSHPAVGGFLTHSGWNSTLESISAGVPMVCWPFFAEQQTNCRYVCANWNVGMEIDSNVRKEEVEGLIKELMVGEKGKEMRREVMLLKDRAVEAAGPSGSSFGNLEKLVKDVLRVKMEKGGQKNS